MTEETQKLFDASTHSLRKLLEQEPMGVAFAGVSDENLESVGANIDRMSHPFQWITLLIFMGEVSEIESSAFIFATQAVEKMTEINAAASGQYKASGNGKPKKGVTDEQESTEEETTETEE
jgi:hypothetical protein